MRPKIILASASVRRSKILSQCNIPHRVVVSNIEEIMEPRKSAGYNALVNACHKCEAVSRRYKAAFVIGADTIVLSGGKLIGKPKDKAHARQLLKEFSGRTISVYTGLCVRNANAGKSCKAVVESKIKVKKISPGKIDKFLKALGPFDKAGGFSIEGAGSFIFDNIEGSFYNVLGLPMTALYDMFEKLGINLLD